MSTNCCGVNIALVAFFFFFFACLLFVPFLVVSIIFETFIRIFLDFQSLHEEIMFDAKCNKFIQYLEEVKDIKPSLRDEKDASKVDEEKVQDSLIQRPKGANSTEHTELKEGDKVNVHITAQGLWHPGKIVKIHHDGEDGDETTYDINYDRKVTVTL